ncbi:MAG: outer membrane lipoprotein carrier protein LolA [Acidobacteriia bacterium]|nr:outer membrane lipoprotein carrier protein LolA [Terriglobia bacterium]
MRVSGVAMVLAALVVSGGAGMRAEAEPAVGGGEIEGLERWLDGTNDLTCRFEQRLLSGALGAGTRESGVFYLLRPGRLRWDYLHPEPKTAIVEGARTLLYIPEDRQLIRGRLDPDQDLLPALLAGRGAIGGLFDAEFLGYAGSGAARIFRVRLVPHAVRGGVEEVVLTVRTPGGAIEGAEVLDPAGNRMQYLFTRVRRNTGLSASVFTFEPPPGTEIVDSP